MTEEVDDSSELTEDDDPVHGSSMEGCGTAALIFLLCALGGPILDAQIVGGIRADCLGDLSSGENFSGFAWLLGRFALFGVFAIVWPVIAVIAERMAEHMGWIRLTPRRIFLSVLFLAMLSVAALIAYDVQALDCLPVAG
ncbi:hypothetical protein Acor_52090 [Acrocarpospora corrugata]|uniref:Uncharacterized protein n=1 Tax=Acrocarpospora corrugata TaxID=35763 RepID=A0A5M3W7G4_9ACTN|nr:hypothetical protein [Acrocarpospora corrugata]GES03143.1 hypothetical protein Acor_52090 [Acrocarpospora corrugata]